MSRRLRPSAYRRLVGVGGIGSGIFLALEGNRTLGRNESHVVPIGALGADETGRRLLAEMAAAGIDTAHVREVADRPTLLSVCFQYPDGSGGNVTPADSAAVLTGRDVERASELLDARTIALAMPEVGLEPRQRLLELATEAGAFRAGSFTSGELAEATRRGMLALLDLLALNEDEAAALAGRRLHAARPEPFLRALGAAVGPRVRVVVTAGAHGAFALGERGWVHRPALPAEVRSTAGAGDALLGAALAALAAGVPLTANGPPDALRTAIDLGVALAGLSVTSPHTIHPGADLAAVLAFAARAGLAPAPPLAEAITGTDADTRR